MDHPVNTFVPSDDLEEKLLCAMSGEIPSRDFLRLLLRVRVAVPSATAVTEKWTDLSPVFFDKAGEQMLAVFSSLERAKRLSPVAAFCLEMAGHEVIARMPPGCGLVLNPGWSAGLDIPSSGIAQLSRDFRAGSI